MAAEYDYQREFKRLVSDYENAKQEFDVYDKFPVEKRDADYYENRQNAFAKVNGYAAALADFVSSYDFMITFNR